MRRILALLVVVGFLTSYAEAYSRADSTGLPTDILQEIPDTIKLPNAVYTHIVTWPAVGGPLEHVTGSKVSDPSAYSGTAWQVNRSDQFGAAALYGPYLPLTPGDYVVFFRIKRIGTAGETSLGRIDCTTAFGQNVLNSVELQTSYFPRNVYREIPIPFSYQSGNLETRLMWNGYAPLNIDNVQLFRLSGTNIQITPQRAPAAVETTNPSNIIPVAVHTDFYSLFPRSKTPQKHLDVLDLSHLLPDQKLMYLALEGLVNRQKPRIYLLYNPTDMKWLKWMKTEHWINSYSDITAVDLLKKYRNYYHGVVVFDPSLPATINLATMLAGVKNCLVASPQIAKSLNLPVLMDLRGKWHTSVAVYSWAFNHLWPQLSHKIIACTDPDQLGLRDYLVENKVYLFWISGPIDGAIDGNNPQAEMNLMEKLLGKMPADISVLSYPYDGVDIGVGEGAGVGLFAEFGKFLVGTTDCSNLSVHSGIRHTAFKQLSAPAPPLKKKVYVTWIMSDGDNLPVLSVGNFPEFWKSKARGDLPIGWSMSPSAGLLMPDIADYYYRTATPDDEFVGAVSGVGYTYPQLYGIRFKSPFKQDVWDGFLKETAEGYAFMDMHLAWIMNANAANIADYALHIPHLAAIFPDYGRTVTSYGQATTVTNRNVPVFHAITSWSPTLSRAQQEKSVVQQIRSFTPTSRPAFLHLFALNWFTSPDELLSITRMLGNQYEVVRPDQLAALYSEYEANQKVAVSAPQSFTTLGNHPSRFSITLQNTYQGREDVKISAADFGSADITPSRLTLLVGHPYAVSVNGVANGPEIELEIFGEGINKKIEIPVNRIEPDDILGGALSSHLGVSQFILHIDAASLQHGIGEVVNATSSETYSTWESPPASAGNSQGGYLQYGPYAEFSPGDYTAYFRIKKTEDGVGNLCKLDISSHGGMKELASSQITSSELTVGKYTYIPLYFHVDRSERIETRIYWNGTTSMCSSSVDIFQNIHHGAK